jgi:hypothetical protein
MQTEDTHTHHEDDLSKDLSNAFENAATMFDPSIPLIVLAWDPDLLSEDDYCEIVTTLGELVRAHGGIGIKRIHSKGFGIEIEAGVKV